MAWPSLPVRLVDASRCWPIDSPTMALLLNTLLTTPSRGLTRFDPFVTTHLASREHTLFYTTAPPLSRREVTSPLVFDFHQHILETPILPGSDYFSRFSQPSSSVSFSTSAARRCCRRRWTPVFTLSVFHTSLFRSTFRFPTSCNYLAEDHFSAVTFEFPCAKTVQLKLLQPCRKSASICPRNQASSY